MQCTPLRFSPPRLQIQFSQGISILVARLDAMGLIQYADNASNTMCNFFRNAPKRDGWNYQMKCRDFCAWNSGKRRHQQLPFRQSTLRLRGHALLQNKQQPCGLLLSPVCRFGQVQSAVWAQPFLLGR
jgi:hypothetical protein